MTMHRGTVPIIVFLLMTILCAPPVVAQSGAPDCE